MRSKPSRNSGDSVGDMVCKLVLNYLQSSGHYEVTAYTFTELLAFVYVVIDRALFYRGMSSREAVSHDISTAHSETLQKRFGVDNADPHNKALDVRCDEYAEMIRAGKHDGDIIFEKLSFFLDQASELGHYDGHGEAGGVSPVVMRDIFQQTHARVDLAEFYVDTLAPFIMHFIVAKNDRDA